MQTDGRELYEYLTQHFPGAAHIEVNLQGCWGLDREESYTWEVRVHFPKSDDPDKQVIRLTEPSLEVIKIKLEAEVASRKVLARLNLVPG